MCGIIGVTGVDNAVVELYAGLYALQHRGQDAAGIMTSNGERFFTKKGLKLVKDVFGQQHFESFVGGAGLGHVRYATVGGGRVDEIQPDHERVPFMVSMCYNGNLTNYTALRKSNSMITSACDLDGILKEFIRDFEMGDVANESDEFIDKVFEAIGRVMKNCEGSYSVIAHIPGLGMLGFKDPYGIKPLCVGRKPGNEKDAFCFASEDIALQHPLGYDYVKEIPAGSAYLVTESGKIIEKNIENSVTPHPCIFEWIYFADESSSINGISVSEFRYQLGKELALAWIQDERPIHAAMSCSLVPSASARGAAGFSEWSHIKNRPIIRANKYVPRTFITSDKATREFLSDLKMKINFAALADATELVLVDDSIVRAHTSRKLVQRIREECARRNMPLEKIHFLSTAPPNMFPCVYGIDMAVDKELIAAKLPSVEEIRKYIGVDTLVYQDISVLNKVLDRLWKKRIKPTGLPFIGCITEDPSIKCCDACFSGFYPTGLTSEDIERMKLERIKDKGCDYS